MWIAWRSARLPSEVGAGDRRAAILDLLREYRSRWADERQVVDRYRAFVARHPDCFERSLEVGHVTGSAWVVDASGTRVLLTHHKKLDIWVQLGGHADGNSSIAEVAHAEATEESGIAGLEFVDERLFDVDIHTIPARPAEPEHLHYDARFALRAPADAEVTVGPESHALAWVDIDALATVTRERSMLRMGAKWLARG